MKVVDKILAKIEYCIHNGVYESVETEKVELKPTPANLIGSKSMIQSINAFLNTDGGIMIVGIYDNQKEEKYEIKGYREDFEGILKSFPTIFEDDENQQLDLREFVRNFEIVDFLDDRICILYIDKLPEDLKYAFYKGEAWERKLTGDHHINASDIEKRKEFREEIRNAKELEIVKEATLEDIDLDKLNEYIQLLNREIKTETVKANLESALPFLSRKKFIINSQVTILGMLVSGQHVKDFMGWRSQVDGFVDTPFEVAQDKKSLIDNVIPLMEKSLGYILKNIQVGVTSEKGGTSKPEYPEKLLRETINNALAHRDYSVDKYVNINIRPNEFIEIRNPGSFKKQLLIEILNDDIAIRRIIPDSQPRNPKLADVLKVFDKWEGKAKGMSNLVNESLENKIDLPYYRFYSKNDLGLFIQKGKLFDDSFEALLDCFDFFIEKKLDGATISKEEKNVLAYYYKSEIYNAAYKYTILLTPDNNHLNAITHLEKAGLIYKHELSPELYPVYLVNRELMRNNYYRELRQVFGGAFDDLSDIYKQTLSLIFQVNNYNKAQSISATQAGRLLFYRNNEPANDIKAFDSFKRKIYGVFRKLVSEHFLIEKDRRYFVNKEYVRKPSIFDQSAS